ncbi:acyl-CoA dehydrogenase [Nocardia grenadensis]|uniref:acyl-CoA dehydrogenase n=1 Tax=Nocardia grenadensis TaxID=931537 RepID=UPI003D748FF3
MSHYRGNLRDLYFNLFEVLGPARVTPPSRDLDDEATAREVLAEAARLAEGPIAASFTDGDRQAPVYDPRTCSVALPEPIRAAFRILHAAGWWRVDVPEELGGIDVSRPLAWAITELLVGANPALQLYLASVVFASTLHRHGTPEQRCMAARIIERGWGATMVLTEPEAGSDVGAARTHAVQQPDGSWHIEGVKRFITSAEHDLTENIVHLVLARPVGARTGTRGLSMFMVPKFHVDPRTGELGARNGVYATNLEQKLGIKASATCELTFGARDPAVGWLVGDVHDGMKQMFEIIRHTRMLVGTKAIATLSTGYLNAVEYARTRVQSADLMHFNDADAPKVAIIEHPDVRRTLLLGRAYAEGLRALVLYTASWQELAIGNELDSDARDATAIVDFLLPVLKGAGAQRADEQLSQLLQVFGGSGYLQDFPMEQYVRDVKVDSLYEGTLAIQANDLLLRRVIRDDRRGWRLLAAEIRSYSTSAGSCEELRRAGKEVGRALDNIAEMIEVLADRWARRHDDARNAHRVGEESVRFLLSVGDLLVGYLLLRHATVAHAQLVAGEAGGDRSFYEAKVSVARFFARSVLPELAARREIVVAGDDDLAALSPETF